MSGEETVGFFCFSILLVYCKLDNYQVCKIDVDVCDIICLYIIVIFCS